MKDIIKIEFCCGRLREGPRPPRPPLNPGLCVCSKITRDFSKSRLHILLVSHVGIPEEFDENVRGARSGLRLHGNGIRTTSASSHGHRMRTRTARNWRYGSNLFEGEN
jgi:hypothetical protein